jgi:hypothetical protein
MAEREQFVERDLSGARFVECDLSGVVMRGVEIAGMDIDAPWLSESLGLQVNGVDVTPYVEAELDRRFPGRRERRLRAQRGCAKRGPRWNGRGTRRSSEHRRFLPALST